MSCADLLIWTPEMTQRLCKHIVRHGPTAWEEVADALGRPPVLVALRWNVLRLAHETARQAQTLWSCTRRPGYSDWEISCLFVAQHTCLLEGLSKQRRYAALAGWLPGRSITGLKQAYASHVKGLETQVAAKIAARGWPMCLPELLQCWPGPARQDVEGRSSTADKAAAQAILASPAADKTKAATMMRAPASAGAKRKRAPQPQLLPCKHASPAARHADVPRATSPQPSASSDAWSPPPMPPPPPPAATATADAPANAVVAAIAAVAAQVGDARLGACLACAGDLLLEMELQMDAVCPLFPDSQLSSALWLSPPLSAESIGCLA